ncbi:MAG TPA: tryptophan 7-halogenase [Allosphingosinicella sp.]|jgi:2-polyprenyl-6-methoxyphenol hydroxylase-like FAD-dependent oxidoreductase
MAEINADIGIVGGGPAGACAAMRLADLGHRVVLLERERFPRVHVGEALSPGVAAQLGSLGSGGLLGRVGALRFDSSLIRWGGGWEVRPAHWDAVTVDRGRFDSALLIEAERRGAIVVQPARARSCIRTRSGWRVEADVDGGRKIVDCGFLIDASGRSGFLGRRRVRSSATFALHAYWCGRAPTRPAVVAGADHWIWAAPVPGLGCSIMLFLDKEGLRRRRGDIEGSYRADLKAAGLLGRDGAWMLGPVRLCDSSAYEGDEVAGADWLRIGEAAFALDPLSASGVQKAIATALTGAIVANTLLRRPGNAALALDFYRSEQKRTFRRHLAWAGAVYAENRSGLGSSFWEVRSASAQPEGPTGPMRPLAPAEKLVLSAEARFEAVATIGPTFIEARPGIVPPADGRPIAFLGGIELAPFLSRHLPASAADLAKRLAIPAPYHSLKRLIELGILSRSATPSSDTAP